jgi:hypothetical protein
MSREVRAPGHATRRLSRHWAAPVVAVVSALLFAPSTAGAFSIGPGEQPGLAVDAAGTAYIAWNGPSASLQFCRLPRGAAACDIRYAIPAAGASIRRPFLAQIGSRVSILQTRYPLQGGDPPAGLYRFTSEDGGATFGAAEQVGTLDMYDGVVGPGASVSGVTDSSAQGGAFQNVSLITYGGTLPLAQLWGGDHPYGGSVGLIDAATPLVIFANGSGAAQFRRYAGSGDLDDAANWTPAADIGTVSYTHLTGGPMGLFLITTNPDGTLVSRKFDGTTFGADVAISAGVSAPSVHAFEDAGGRLHVVFQRGGPQGRDLIHAVSDDGTTWRSGTLVTTPDPGDSFGDTRVATAADHIGVVVWKGVANGVAEIRVEALGPDAPDATSPETKIKKGPKTVETSKPKAKITFTFTSSEPGSTFECRLDKKPFKACSSPTKVKAKLGKHRFQVQASDAAGNPDLSPVTFKFKVLRK